MTAPPAKTPAAPAARPTEAPTLLVVAAVIIEGTRVLLTQRKAGTHLAGAWEFPGGKVRAGEDPRHALVRELREELGIDAVVGEVMDVTFHRYPERSVLLLFFEVRRVPHSPEPRALDVADYRWAGDDELDEATFPPADVAILRKVRVRLVAV
ncbi:MAG TPA: (deoxy)nucleoside triphosphate pyrophosphohydrolase [Polyangiaceae bacterium]|nr:(deoxy)nucleoside triphosphate pyrophosphohydrolase [Polyangiaceae bacterium]